MSRRPRGRGSVASAGRWQRLGLGALLLWLALAGGWASAHRAAHALQGTAAHAPAAHGDGAHHDGAFGGHAAGSDECRWLDHLGSGEAAIPMAWGAPHADGAAPPPVGGGTGRALPAPGAFQARAPPSGGGHAAARPA